MEWNSAHHCSDGAVATGGGDGNLLVIAAMADLAAAVGFGCSCPVATATAVAASKASMFLAPYHCNDHIHSGFDPFFSTFPVFFLRSVTVIV